MKNFYNSSFQRDFSSNAFLKYSLTPSVFIPRCDVCASITNIMIYFSSLAFIEESLYLTTKQRGTIHSKYKSAYNSNGKRDLNIAIKALGNCPSKYRDAAV